MKHRHHPLALLCFPALVGVFVGCNAILENTPAEVGSTPSEPLPNEPFADSSTPAVADDASSPPTPPGSDAGVAPPTPPTPPTDGGAPGCPDGKQLCDGLCVSVADPAYGCGDPRCTPCPSAHGTMGCLARKCAVAACDVGYADCNADPADGCETDLSRATSCGACNAVCANPAPLCAPAGATFQCTNGCGPGAPLACGADCVDPLTSTRNCGGCNVKCPDVTNGTSQCMAGACGFTCKNGFHACGGRCATKTDATACGPDCVACPVPPNGRATCVQDACSFTCNGGFNKCADRCVPPNDPTACGATCAVCPTPPNAVAACNAGACAFTCSAGFGNCDANPANGCEAAFASDPLNCGQCGKSCAGQPCVNGACQAPPPPPP